MKPWEEYQKKPWEEYSAPEVNVTDAVEPVEPPTPGGRGRDALRAVGRVVEGTVNAPQDVAGLLGKGTEWMRGKVSDWEQTGDEPPPVYTGVSPDDRRPSSVLTRALHASGAAPRPRAWAGPKVEGDIENLMEREVPQGQSEAWDRGMLGIELGSGALINPKKPLTDLGAAAGGMLGDWVGGTPGMVAGALTGGVAGGSVQSSLSNAAAKRAGVPSATQNYRAAQVIENSTGETLEETAAKVDALRRPGEVGTVGDIVAGRTPEGVPHDTGALAVEKLAAGSSPQAQEVFEGVAARRGNQILGEAGDVIGPGTVDPTDLTATGAAVAERKKLEILAEQLRGETTARGVETGGITSARATAMPDEQAAADAAAELAHQRTITTQTEDAARAAQAGVLDSALPPGAQSTKVHAAVEGGYKGAKEDAAVAWNKFDTGGDVDVTGLRMDMQDYLTQNFPDGSTKAKAFAKTFGKTLDQWRSMPANTRPDDISYLISQTKAQLENAAKNNNFTIIEKRMRELNEIADNYMASPLGSPGYEAARKATREAYKRYALRDIKADPATFIKGSNIKGQEGLKTARMILATKDVNVIKAAEDYVISLAKKHVETGGDLAKFMADNSEFISQFGRLENLASKAKHLSGGVAAQRKLLSDTEAVFDTADKARTAAQKTETATVGGLKQAREKAEKELGATAQDKIVGLDKTVLADFTRAPQAFVKRAITKEDRIPQFKSVYERMKKEGKGEEFKALVRREVMGELGSPKGGIVTAPSRTITDFNKIRKQLVDSEVITSGEADKIASTLQRTSTSSLRQSVRKAENEKLSKEISNLTASAIAAQTTAKLPAGHSLMMAGAVRRAVSKFLDRDKTVPDPKVMQAITEAMSDPDSFKEFIKDVKNPKKIEEAIYHKILVLEQLTGENQEEEQ